MHTSVRPAVGTLGAAGPRRTSGRDGSSRSRAQLAASIGAAIIFIGVGVGSVIAHATSGAAPNAPATHSSVTGP